MSEEIKSTVAGEVSSVAAPKVKVYSAKSCDACLKEFTPTSANQKTCSVCRESRDKKEYARVQKAKSRAETKAREAKKLGMPKCDTEINDKEAAEILAARGLRNPRVIEVSIELAKTAARNLRIPFNAHLLKEGVQATLAAREKREFVAPDNMTADVWTPGEPIREMDRYALWDFSASWRTQPDGSTLTFERWKELRRISQTDLFRFGKDILGLDMHEEPHGRWCEELFVKKNPDLLPENYTWEDVKVALAAQSDIRQRLLIASRSSYKSSVNLVDLLQWTLVFNGDLRIFIVSATTPLSAGFLRKYRGYFTLKNPNEPTLFNQLWPEHMVSADDSSSKKSFVSLTRRLDLIQPTLTSTSLDSEGLAGERMDLFVMEDIAEINNSSNPEQRAKTLEKADLLRELLEPFGSLQVVGTPISAGAGTDEDPGDIYSTLLKREDDHQKNGGEPRLKYLICPAWTVKEGVNKEAYDITLTEDEVSLLFPSRLTFKYLHGKLRENQKVFRQQSLCTWVADESTLDLLNFDVAVLRQNLVHHEAAPQVGFVVILGDIAYSTNAKADNSAIAAIRIFENETKEKCMCVLDVIAKRMRGSMFATELVLACRKWNPRSVVLERTPAWDLLQAEINQAIIKFPTTVPLHWHTPSNVKDAKFLRLKGLEGLVQAGRIKFVAGAYTDELFRELERLDGSRGGKGTRHDDRADCLALCQQLFCPAITYTFTKSSEEDELQREEERRALQRMQYNRIFGHEIYTPPKPEPVTEPQAPRDPRLAIFGSRGKWRM
jgi:hypothetical protein